jgi:hypothetical protein
VRSFRIFDDLFLLASAYYEERIVYNKQNLSRLFRLFITNGLTICHPSRYRRNIDYESNKCASLLQLYLYLNRNNVNNDTHYLMMLECMVLQLLSLGYGRYTEFGPVADAGFIEEHSFLVKHTELTNSEDIPAEFIQLVMHLVSVFDSGPLSLQQLSRIAIRRAVGGVHFARRVRTLPLPPPLIRYVTDATEYLDDPTLPTPVSVSGLCC